MPSKSLPSLVETGAATSTQISSQPKVKLRINELMAERGIKSVAALHRMLISKHVAVSHSQLSRIVDNRADHWKVEFIEIFLDIFQCHISDLFRVEVVAK